MESEAFYHDIKIVDKYLKKLKLNKILTVKLENYNGSYIYMGVVFHKRSKTFRTFWVDLGKLGNKHIEDWFNSNLMFPNEAEQLKSIIARNGISKSYVDNDDIEASHSAYIGTFDPEVLFYMMSRGLTKKECDDLLIKAFLLHNMELDDKERDIYCSIIEKINK